MCGVFGGIKKFNPDKIKVLGILNMARGTHGAGLFDLHDIVKSNDDFHKFCNEKAMPFLHSAKKFIVGHTRYATCGSKTDENAHPFKIGKITGVHNGQIRNFEVLKKKYGQDKLNVDSEIIFYLLDQKGIEGLRELIGYYTVIWANAKKPDKIFIIQHECDLAYCKTKEALYFSSDEDDLFTAIGGEGKIVESLEDTLYEIDINTLKIRTKKIKGLKVDTGFNYTKYKNGYGGNYDEDELWESGYHIEGGGQSASLTNMASDDNLAYTRNYENSNGNYPYYFQCPQCIEYLTEDEVRKGHCGTCRYELSGVIYECKDCEAKVLLEQVMEIEKEECIYCGGKIECLPDKEKAWDECRN